MRSTLSLTRLRLSPSGSARTSLSSRLLSYYTPPRSINGGAYCSAVVVGSPALTGTNRTSTHRGHHEANQSAFLPGQPYGQPRSARLLVASSGGGFALLLVVSLGVVGIGLSALQTLRRKKVVEHLIADDNIEKVEAMTADVAPGRPGNLTPEQEEKLRHLWQLVFQVCGVNQPENGVEAVAEAAPSAVASGPAVVSEKVDSKAKKSRMSLFSRRGRKESDADVAPAPAPSGPAPSLVLSPAKDGEDDKYGQTRHFYDTLASMSPESIRATIWSMVKHDHPDALLLRFLRARKWDVEKALVMMISTMNWRAKEMKVDEDIMRNGDAAAAEAEKNATDAAAKRLGHDFLEQARMGKSFIHGFDKVGRPVCYVRCRLHKQGEQVEESLERYTVYVIETCRYLLQPPVDTATIVFDMTGFSLANMDYTPVKFMIKCFEANYPESLGAVLVHKAPWVFQGIWRVIRGWLDPVVANKVHFTNNVTDMEAFISAERLPKELEGEEDWEYKFVGPIPGENDRMNDIATRDRLLAARESLVKEFEGATLQWIQNPEAEKAVDVKARRTDLAAQLREDYWGIDPYVRARSLYDRTGVLLPGGKINFYPQTEAEKAVESITNGVDKVAITSTTPSAVETSADDVD